MKYPQISLNGYLSKLHHRTYSNSALSKLTKNYKLDLVDLGVMTDAGQKLTEHQKKWVCNCESADKAGKPRPAYVSEQIASEPTPAESVTDTTQNESVPTPAESVTDTTQNESVPTPAESVTDIAQQSERIAYYVTDPATQKEKRCFLRLELEFVKAIDAMRENKTRMDWIESVLKHATNDKIENVSGFIRCHIVNKLLLERATKPQAD